MARVALPVRAAPAPAPAVRAPGPAQPSARVSEPSGWDSFPPRGHCTRIGQQLPAGQGRAGQARDTLFPGRSPGRIRTGQVIISDP